MAEIKTTIVFDTDKNSFKIIEKQSKKAGKKAGDGFSDGFEKETTSGITSAFKQLKGAAAAAGVAIAAAFSASRVVTAAIQQEDAVNRLNASLRRIGEFSELASQDIQSFASQLQQQSRFGDEVILQNVALAQSYGATAKQSKELVQAALDLAAAQGTDLNSAVRQISKTLGGYAGELGEVLPALKTLTQEQLRNGEAIKLISDLYKGFAEREANTFGAALQRLANGFGDVVEEIGFFITKSETGKELIETLTSASNLAVIGLRKFRLALSEVSKEDVAERISNTKNEIALLEKELEKLKTQDASKIVGRLGLEARNVSGPINDAKVRIGILTKQLEELKKFAKDNGLKDLGNDAKEATNNLALSSEQFNQALAGFGIDNSRLLRDQLNKEFEVVREAKERRIISEEQFQQRLRDIREEFAFKTQDPSVQQGFEGIVKGFGDSEASAESFNAQVGALGKNIRNQLGQSLAGAIANIGKALVTGENAFSNFGDGILKLFGEIALQIGTFFVALGTGYLFSGIPKFEAIAPNLIAAGAALSFLGGVLSAFSGSSSTGAGGAASSTGGGGVSVESPEVAESVVEERPEEQQAITINIQGDVLDSRESSLRIAELLNQATEQEGAVLV